MRIQIALEGGAKVLAGLVGAEQGRKREVARGDFDQGAETGLPQGVGILDAARQEQDGNGTAAAQHAVGRFPGEGLTVGFPFAGDDQTGAGDQRVEAYSVEDGLNAGLEPGAEIRRQRAAESAGSTGTGQ